MKIYFAFIISLFFVNSYAQQKNFIDQPYLETNGKADTLITPDRIFIKIILNEADSKNKKSTEELEKTLEQTLKRLNIDTEKQLTLLDYNSDFKTYFLKSQSILKVKNYSLLVYDAATASKVFTLLESEGISNVSIEKTEYSKAEELLLKLKTLAVQHAKANGKKLLEPLNQRLGKAIFVSDINNNISEALQGKIPGIQLRGTSSIYCSKAPDTLLFVFKKLKFEAKVNVIFIIE